MPEVASWIVGLSLTTIAVLKLLWGADLVVTEMMFRPERHRLPVTSGAFWLGNHFLMTGISINGLLGILLLNRPDEDTPLWFAIPIAIATVEAGLAWHFLSREARERRASP